MSTTTREQARRAGFGRVAWTTHRSEAKRLLRRLAEFGVLDADTHARCLDYLPVITADPDRWGLFGVDMLAKPRDVMADLKEMVPKYLEWAAGQAPKPRKARTGRKHIVPWYAGSRWLWTCAPR